MVTYCLWGGGGAHGLRTQAVNSGGQHDYIMDA